MTKLMDNLAQQVVLKVTHSYAHTFSTEAVFDTTTIFFIAFRRLLGILKAICVNSTILTISGSFLD